MTSTPEQSQPGFAVDAALSAAHTGYDDGEKSWDFRARAVFKSRMKEAGVQDAELVWVAQFEDEKLAASKAAAKKGKGIIGTTLKRTMPASKPKPDVTDDIFKVQVGHVHVEPYKFRLRAFTDMKGTIPPYQREKRYKRRFAILADYWMGILRHCTWRGGLVKAFEEPSLKLPGLSEQGYTIPRSQFLMALNYALLCSESLLDREQWGVLLQDLYEVFDVSGEGAVDYREFIAALQLFRRAASIDVDPEQLVLYWYSAYDGKAAGGLPPDDFMAMLCTLCTSGEEASGVLSLVDLPALVRFCQTGEMPLRVKRGSLLWKRFDPKGESLDQPESQLAGTLAAFEEHRKRPNSARWGYGLSKTRRNSVQSDDSGIGAGSRRAASVSGTNSHVGSSRVPSESGHGGASQYGGLEVEGNEYGNGYGEDGQRQDYSHYGDNDGDGDATDAHPLEPQDDEYQIARQAERAQAMADQNLAYTRTVKPGCIDEAGIHLLFRLRPELSHVIHRMRLGRTHASLRAKYMRRQLALELEKAHARYQQARALVGEERARAWHRFVEQRKVLRGWQEWLHDKRVRASLVVSFMARR